MEARKRCALSSLEVMLATLFVTMTIVSVTLIAVTITRSANTCPELTPPPSVTPSPDPRPPFLIGVGRADCTGPPAELPLMGYANPQQTAAGIHTRLFSRAFIIDDGRRRVVFVAVDVGMISQRLRLEVLKALRVKYGELYRQDNVVLSGTHTHSGPAGYFQYTLFMISSKGYLRSSVQPLVRGIVKSIDRAHGTVRPGRIYKNRGRVDASSVNRSPHSYRHNPQDERIRYDDDVDKDMVLLKFADADGDGIGLLSWFAVHAVSMKTTNRLVSGDNLGYAAYLMEKDKNPAALPGQAAFVAAFSSSNLGDVSPNVRGPRCVNSGLACDYLNSSCPEGGTKECQAFGPGEDMFDSTRIIGLNIYRKARELYADAADEVTGFIHSAHQWVNMTDVAVHVNDTHVATTCKPALGHSFAAGTTDGGGDLNFTQGAVEGDPFWDGIRDALLGQPSNRSQECHRPKPILFSTGEMNWPLPWHPEIIDIQILTVGSVAVVAVPGEITTMAGRRLRETVERELQSEGGFWDVDVVIAGLSNVYTHYITTYEEYQVQRYEGASTIFGPHTLGAYLLKFGELARAIAQVRPRFRRRGGGFSVPARFLRLSSVFLPLSLFFLVLRSIFSSSGFHARCSESGSDRELGGDVVTQDRVGSVPPGPPPPFFQKNLFNLLPAAQVDRKPDNSSFGEVLVQVLPAYRQGDVVSVTFVAGNPRHSGDVRDRSFVAVEMHDAASDSWTLVHTDASWETRYVRAPTTLTAAVSARLTERRACVRRQVPLAQRSRAPEQRHGGVAHPRERRRRVLQDQTLRPLQEHKRPATGHHALPGHVRRLPGHRRFLFPLTFEMDSGDVASSFSRGISFQSQQFAVSSVPRRSSSEGSFWWCCSSLLCFCIVIIFDRSNVRAKGTLSISLPHKSFIF
ncbi:neutral ceramidase isoform X2 [Syngnathoides biaculeatus]|uniref:neutral ceramidase isoform X2 n=1 Tax=Syngnathoides biaculeatus TaxID=300417 RepID=UPI002ADE1E7C|nr:neutral ceramidase isoform X2 [Syngnathoides biaculeatus]